MKDDIIDMHFIQNGRILNLVTLHSDSRIVFTSLRTKQTIFEKYLPFEPVKLIIDPNLDYLLVTVKAPAPGSDLIEDVQKYKEYEWEQSDDTEVAFIKINLRLKENANFNLNDGFIEAFKYLPCSGEYKD